MSSGNCPIGAECDSNAPWNEKEIKDIAKCTATVWFSVERKVELETEITIVPNSFGDSYHVPQSVWEGIYTEECLDPVELIRELVDVIKKHINPRSISKDETERINHLINESKGWTCDEWNFKVED